MTQPLVSVICLCYNHARFVTEAIESVITQTYKNLQIIVVDDASTDNSVEEIEKVIAGREIEFISLKQNAGNCAAFNRGLSAVKGEYVVDFATDDVMIPQRIAQQIAFFQTLDSSYGVVFTDAEYINAEGEIFRNHYDYLFEKKLLKKIPSGNVYREILTTYFVAAPTMLVRKKVFDDLGGYDEQLAYEDFDFWVRSSRLYQYAFLNEKLTRIRRVQNSLSAGLYSRGDRQLHSTYLVCRKAIELNRTPDERNALIHRVRYELRQSVFTENHGEARLFYKLLADLMGIRIIDRFTFLLSTTRIPLSWMRRLYYRLRFG